jgi:hypothetical protein
LPGCARPGQPLAGFPRHRHKGLLIRAGSGPTTLPCCQPWIACFPLRWRAVSLCHAAWGAGGRAAEAGRGSAHRGAARCHQHHTGRGHSQALHPRTSRRQVAEAVTPHLCRPSSAGTPRCLPRFTRRGRCRFPRCHGQSPLRAGLHLDCCRHQRAPACFRRCAEPPTDSSRGAGLIPRAAA